MNRKEPPGPQQLLYMIGRDSQGHWVVQDQSGLHGGLFVNRAEALKFALFENGRRPQAVVMVPGALEMNMDGRVMQPARNSNTHHQHAA